MYSKPKIFFPMMALLGVITAAPSSAQSTTSPDALSTEIQALSTYDLGLDRTQVAALMDDIRSLGDAGHAKVEAALIPILTDAKTPVGAKDVTCRLLGQIGSDQSVPALSGLLSDSRLSHMAAYGLFEIGTPAAQAALLKSLDSIPDNLQPAVIGALGRLHDADALSTLTKLASTSPAVSDAAINALSDLASTQAADALASIKAPADVQNDLDWARIRLAKSLLSGSASDKDSGTKTLTSLAQSSNLNSVQVASATALMQADPSSGWSTLSELLKSTNRHTAVDAARLTPLITSDPFEALTKLFPTLDPSVQIVIVNSFSESSPQNAGTESLIKLALDSDKPDVHLAAIRGLGYANLPTSTDLLQPFLNKSKDESTVALEALSRLKTSPFSANFDFAKASSAEKITHLTLITQRQEIQKKDEAFTAASDPDATVQNAAYQAIAVTASADDLEKLITLLPAAKSDDQRKSLNRALSRSANLAPDKSKTQDELISVLEKTPPDNRQGLVLVLISMGSDKSTDALSKLLDDPSVDSRKDLIRTLSEGRNPVADKLLVQAAKNGKEDSEKILALRGYLDSIHNQKINNTTRISDLKSAWPLAIRQEEKDAIIAALKEMKGDGLKVADDLQATNTTVSK